MMRRRDNSSSLSEFPFVVDGLDDVRFRRRRSLCGDDDDTCGEDND